MLLLQHYELLRIAENEGGQQKTSGDLQKVSITPETHIHERRNKKKT